MLGPRFFVWLLFQIILALLNRPVGTVQILLLFWAGLFSLNLSEAKPLTLSEARFVILTSLAVEWKIRWATLDCVPSSVLSVPSQPQTNPTGHSNLWTYLFLINQLMLHSYGCVIVHSTKIEFMEHLQCATGTTADDLGVGEKWGLKEPQLQRTDVEWEGLECKAHFGLGQFTSSFWDKDTSSIKLYLCYGLNCVRPVVKVSVFGIWMVVRGERAGRLTWFDPKGIQLVYIDSSAIW